ncbi:MAG: TIGR02466 family protein [Clostridia bacterium]
MTFNGVWATFLARRRLPAFEEPNRGLAAFIAEQEAREKDYTVRFYEQNFFASQHPSVRWLRGEVDDTIKAYLSQAGVTQLPSWTIHGWYNTNRYGDHHAPHTHPRSYLSGTYYVQVPEAASGSSDPKAHPACISFYDPRTGANMAAVAGDRDSRASYIVSPSAGMLLMWPSPLQHSVHPNLSQEHRISISFNVMIDPAAYGWNRPADEQ